MQIVVLIGYKEDKPIWVKVVYFPGKTGDVPSLATKWMKDNGFEKSNEACMFDKDKLYRRRSAGGNPDVILVRKEILGSDIRTDAYMPVTKITARVYDEAELATLTPEGTQVFGGLI